MVSIVELWLSNARTDVIIADMIVRYLKEMGRISMTDILHRYHDGNEVRWNRDLSEPLAWGAILVKAAEVPKLIVDVTRKTYFKI